MNKSELKRVIGKLEPAEDMKNRLAARMQEHPGMKKGPGEKKQLQYLAVAAGLFLILSLAFYTATFLGDKGQNDPGNISHNAVDIPKATLPENTEITAKMLPLIVYQGRIYLDGGAQVDPDKAEALLGERLGVTKSGLNEWSTQDDYAVEFASTVGVQEVFTVKGYDRGFRIMTLDKNNGQVFAQIFECLNGISVKSGQDIFEKFRLENNIAAVTYENFDSWNNGKGNVQRLPDPEGMNRFLEALELSVPRARERLEQLFDDLSPDSQKFVYLTLQDGLRVQLRLFEDGYVYLNNADIFFQVDDPAFKAFWSELKQ